MTIKSPEEAKLINLHDCFRKSGAQSLPTWRWPLPASHNCNLSLAADYAPHTGCEIDRKAVYVRFFSTNIGEELQKGVMRAVLRLALKSGSPCCLTMDGRTGSLVPNGFDLEGQGFKHKHQLEIVMAVLNALCVLAGSLKHDAEAIAKEKPAPKKYANGKSYSER
ncbi:MAG: hypothetical protein K9J37_22810 [Saprospiraceae bacterium]|nr:hypothetical protein [Saprospiraceae bacterium]MCF8252757.1 hypothetical protein [Saprospiraceae bacterium]MCF8283129.1 hypothetical protein [Bacteroidales bacterium]MCF8314307.1 hypothetical protein [Saprospiraceae bacterium]MCF8443184.1 hypothetical protein [Saprospiraceae bacterium]